MATPKVSVRRAPITYAIEPKTKLTTSPSRNAEVAWRGIARAHTGGGGSALPVGGSRYGPSTRGGRSGRCGGAAARTRKKTKCRNGRKNSPAQNGLRPMSRSRRTDSATPAAMNGSDTTRSHHQNGSEGPLKRSGLTRGDRYMRGFQGRWKAAATNESTPSLTRNRLAPSARYCERR